jgi:hypothetical protein
MKRAFLSPLTLVLLLVLVIPAATASARTANAAGVRLGYEPGKPVDMITVVLSSETGAARLPLFLEYSGPEALQDVLLYAQVMDENGQPASAGTVQFLDGSQANAALGRMSLLPGALARQVLLDFRDFTFFGNYTGFVAIDVGGSSTRIAGLSVSRPPEGAL